MSTRELEVPETVRHLDADAVIDLLPGTMATSVLQRAISMFRAPIFAPCCG